MLLEAGKKMLDGSRNISILDATNSLSSWLYCLFFSMYASMYLFQWSTAVFLNIFSSPVPSPRTCYQDRFVQLLNHLNVEQMCARLGGCGCLVVGTLSPSRHNVDGLGRYRLCLIPDPDEDIAG